MDKIDISKYDNHLIFEDYLQSKFPVEALTMDCLNKDESIKFYLVGRMKMEFKNDCKQIKFTDLNNKSINLKIKNTLEINF